MAPSTRPARMKASTELLGIVDGEVSADHRTEPASGPGPASTLDQLFLICFAVSFLTLPSVRSAFGQNGSPSKSGVKAAFSTCT